MSFINQFINALKKNSDAENASYMTDYMRGKFQYFGVKTKPRRDILKTVIDENKNEIKENIREITLEFYLLPMRRHLLLATSATLKRLGTPR